MSDARKRAEIISYIASLWEEHPELRFCQLMQFIGGDGDLFYMGDEVFLAKAKARYDQGLAVKPQ